jgi:acetyl esterase/lipase
VRAVNLYEYPSAIHVFIEATFLPESRDAFRKLEESLG